MFSSIPTAPSLRQLEMTSAGCLEAMKRSPVNVLQFPLRKMPQKRNGFGEANFFSHWQLSMGFLLFLAGIRRLPHLHLDTKIQKISQSEFGLLTRLLCAKCLFSFQRVTGLTFTNLAPTLFQEL